VRFEGIVERARRNVDSIDRDFGFAQPGLGVTPLVRFRLAGDVALVVDFRRIGPQGFLDAGDEWQRLVIDLDQAQRIFGQFFRFRRHGGHLVPDQAHGRFEELALLVPGDARHVRRADDGVDTRSRFGSADIDVADARVGVQAT
jgi:hypothetical protein